MSDIFISYARDDRLIAESLHTYLVGKGYSVWYDSKIAPGDYFDETIEDALHRSKAVIVLWTSHSVQSRWVREEAHLAQEAGKLIPVQVDCAEIPFGLRMVHALAATSHSEGLLPQALDSITIALARFAPLATPTAYSTKVVKAQTLAERRPALKKPSQHERRKNKPSTHVHSSSSSMQSADSNEIPDLNEDFSAEAMSPLASLSLVLLAVVSFSYSFYHYWGLHSEWYISLGVVLSAGALLTAILSIGVFLLFGLFAS